MASLADAFVAMPGGYGTFEVSFWVAKEGALGFSLTRPSASPLRSLFHQELFEVITWTQLKLHVKPVLVLNVKSYFSHLVALVDSAVDAGFIRPDLRKATLLAADAVEEVVPMLEAWDGSGIVDVLSLRKNVGEGESGEADLGKV